MSRARTRAHGVPIELHAFSVCGISYAVADAPDYVKAKANHKLRAKKKEKLNSVNMP
jgi:hypothetical protein